MARHAEKVADPWSNQRVCLSVPIVGLFSVPLPADHEDCRCVTIFLFVSMQASFVFVGGRVAYFITWTGCSDLSDSEKGNLTHWKLYFTIAKWISLSTVNECISGYQPTKTKMTLVINHYICHRQYKITMGHGKTIQQAWHWPCIGPNQERSPFIPWKFGY